MDLIGISLGMVYTIWRAFEVTLVILNQSIYLFIGSFLIMSILMDHSYLVFVVGIIAKAIHAQAETKALGFRTYNIFTLVCRSVVWCHTWGQALGRFISHLLGSTWRGFIWCSVIRALP